MAILLIPIFLMLAFFILALSGTTTRPGSLEFRQASKFAAKWLPVAATIGYLLYTVMSLLFRSMNPLPPASLANLFSKNELIVMTCAGCLFLGRFGSILSFITIVFTLDRLMFHNYYLGIQPFTMFVAAQITVLILADKAPWLTKKRPINFVTTIRQSLFGGLIGSSILIAITGIMRAQELKVWLAEIFSLHISRIGLVTILVVIIIGWLAVAYRSMRPFSMPLLALPTTLVLAFLTGWSTLMLTIPFVMALALSLSSSDGISSSHI